MKSPLILLGENRSLRIYLPPGYNELLSYPVIYCQDGEQFFNFGRIATTITRCILDEGLEPAIVVGVDVNNVTALRNMLLRVNAMIRTAVSLQRNSSLM